MVRAPAGIPALCADNDHTQHLMDLLITAMGDKFIDERLNTGVVLCVIVKGNESTRSYPCFKMIKIAGNVKVVMETVDEQEGDRTIPFDLERSLGNGFDEVPDTGIRNIVQESLARRRHLLHPLV